MNNKTKIATASLDKLILDDQNPRFAELYSGSNNEDDLIEYLLYSEAAKEIVNAINQSGEYYDDEHIWVLKKGGQYIVKDGNRRCAAVKSLQNPEKYRLHLSKRKIDELPILIFEDEEYLQKRIRERHTSSLFREWDRIAKALEIYRLHTDGTSIESMKEIDSEPSQLFKLASFYYAAIDIAGDRLRPLLRRGRGKTGGKTIIFERLFKFSKLFCGYHFKNKPLYEIHITDKVKFKNYINAIVHYLIDNPETTHKDADRGQKFLEKLKPHGFDIEGNSTPAVVVSHQKKQKKEQREQHKDNVKLHPELSRKEIPPNLKSLIVECYNLGANNFPNAKTALTRVSLECTLKYVVENTTYKNKKLSDLKIFYEAFFDKKGNRRTFTNFTVLKTKFEELINKTSIKKAFQNFNLDNPHQIIHNYHVGAVPKDAMALCNNLMPLLEFLLQDEDNLLQSLNLGKL